MNTPSTLRESAQLFLDSSRSLHRQFVPNLQIVLGKNESTDEQIQEALEGYIQSINSIISSLKPYKDKETFDISLIATILKVHEILWRIETKNKLYIPAEILFYLKEFWEHAMSILQIPTTTWEFSARVIELKKVPMYRDPTFFGIQFADEERYLIENKKWENTGSAAMLMYTLSLYNPHGTTTKRLTVEDLDRCLEWFKVFEGDGKKHGNIEALKEARRLLLEDPSRKLNMVFDFHEEM